MVLTTLWLVFGSPLLGQTPDEKADLPSLELQEFRPKSMLQVPQTHLTHAKFPVVDVHTHLDYRLKSSRERLDEFVKLMDRNQIALCVSLDAKLGDELTEHRAYLFEKYENRFLFFVHIDWQGNGAADQPETWDCQREDFVRRTVLALRLAKQQGAQGLKLFKQFGLGYKNADGSLLKIDDARWDPIWETCGALGMPVLMHTADPAAFFLPIDKTNERWEELSRHPDWSFHGPEFPSRAELLAARNRIIQRHPETTFIGAHVANCAEDLQQVAGWLDQYPNLYVELASRISELGRQPYSAKRFFQTYQDRILFGTDGPWPEERYGLYWRFLETEDEYFRYSEKPFPPQGFWQIYGLGLPDQILRKIYFENAGRVIPGVREKLTFSVE
ncbi:MAG: amidohydrolase family protein [Pirellulaceae bacterium]